MKSIIRLLRPEQWTKNAFVLAPAFFSHNLESLDKIGPALAAALAFCLVSSAVYIFNDIRDVEADRQHSKKKFRPIASGKVSIPQAWGMLVALLAALAGWLVATETPLALVLVLLTYMAVNIGYSCGLKHLPLVEMFMVASGFVLRLLAGSVVINVSLSSWIFICTALVATLIVVGKRRADMAQDDHAPKKRAVLGEYSIGYLDNLMIMLSSATLVAYLMFCTSEYALNRYGQFLPVTGVFVALGIFRFLQVVIVKNGGDSPSSLVIRDKFIRGSVLLWMLTFFVIVYLR